MKLLQQKFVVGNANFSNNFRLFKVDLISFELCLPDGDLQLGLEIYILSSGHSLLLCTPLFIPVLPALIRSCIKAWRHSYSTIRCLFVQNLRRSFYCLQNVRTPQSLTICQLRLILLHFFLFLQNLPFQRYVVKGVNKRIVARTCWGLQLLFY